jgi:hypothetical protein
LPLSPEVPPVLQLSSRACSSLARGGTSADRALAAGSEARLQCAMAAVRPESRRRADKYKPRQASL